MNEARERQIPGQNPENEQTEEIKRILISATQKKKAERVINSFLKQFPGKSLIQILPVLIKRCSDKTIIRTAIERIEKQDLVPDDQYWLEGIKNQLKQSEQTKRAKSCPK